MNRNLLNLLNQVKILFPILFIIYFISTRCSDKKLIPNIETGSNAAFVQSILNLPELGNDTLRISYFADTVMYIPLETTKESLIATIKRVWMNDSVFLIECYQNGLLLFQSDGKFIKKIGKQGRGPEEYTRIYNFDVIQDTIYISSSGKRSLMRYTLNGKFCDEIYFEFEPVHFSSTSDGKLACYNKYDGKIYVYNRNLHSPDTIIVEYGVTEGRYYYSDYDPFFKTYLQKTFSSLLFCNYQNDTIWSIKKISKEPAFILNTKDQQLPYDKQIEFCKGDLKGWEDVVKPYHIFHVMPFLSSTIIFQSHWMNNKYDAIYLKTQQTGKFERFNTSFIYDDLVGKQKLPFVFHAYSENKLITTTESFKMIKDLNNMENSEKIKEKPSSLWIKQFKTVKQDDNPVLALIIF